MVKLQLAWKEGITLNGWRMDKSVYMESLLKALNMGKIGVYKNRKQYDIDETDELLGHIIDIDFNKHEAVIEPVKEIEDISSYVIGFSYTADIDECSDDRFIRTVVNATIKFATLIHRDDNAYVEKI